MLDKIGKRKLDIRLGRILKNTLSDLSYGETKSCIEGVIEAYVYNREGEDPGKTKNKLLPHNWRVLYSSKKDIPYNPFGDINIDDIAQAQLDVFWQMMQFVRDAKSLFDQMDYREMLTKALRRYLSLCEYDVLDEDQPSQPDAKEKPNKPNDYLFGWAEIAAALGQTNDEAFQKRTKSYVKQYDGPIIFGRQGTPPKVEKPKLIAWWNVLGDRWKELERRHRDTEATTAEKYQHGRDETVVPEIKGHIKRRRSPKN